MPGPPGFDAVLTVEQALGILPATAIASKLAGPAGVQLHRLGNLEWLGFQRAEAPAWHDQVTATLRSHGISARDQVQSGEHALIAEVKFAAVATGKAFTFAPPDWPVSLPDGVIWCPLAGNPPVRRTWAVWLAGSQRRDVAALIAVLDITTDKP